MRIVLCISTLSTGGSERQLSMLGCELRRMGHDVHVIYKVPGRFLKDLEGAGISCHQLRTFSNYSPFIFFKFFKLIRQIKPELIHSWLEMMDVLGGLASRLYSIPWVASERSAASLRNNPIGFIRNILARRTTLVVANSEAGAATLKTQRFNNVVVVPNALTLPKDTTLRAKQPLRLLSVSRLTKTKNYPTLLSALQILASKNIPFTFTLVGGGEERQKLQLLSEHLGLNNLVRFEGEQALVNPYYASASAFISVSLLEGQPNTVLEAAGHNLPLILSDIPAHIESVGQEGAFFCDGLDAVAIATSIENFINEDPALTQVRVNSVYSGLKARDIQAIATRYEQLYRCATCETTKPISQQ